MQSRHTAAARQSPIEACYLTPGLPPPICIRLIRYEIPFDRLEGQDSVQDVGGVSPYFREPASLLFEYDSNLKNF